MKKASRIVMVAARFGDAEAQAVAARYASFGHSNLEEYWTLLWRDPGLRAAPMSALPLSHHFEDHGVIASRTSWDTDATVVAFKAGPPEGHRVAALLPKVPEWRLDSGHAHPDAGSFIIWAKGRYLTGDTGYAGMPSARNHNTLTFGGIGQGVETQHDVWRQMDYRALDGIRIRQVDLSGGRARLVADLAAAYPASAGVKSFTRTFAWDGGSVFTVSDIVTLATPKTAEWHLQSDTPVRGHGRELSERAARQTRAPGVDRVAERCGGHDRARHRAGAWRAWVDRERSPRKTRPPPAPRRARGHRVSVRREAGSRAGPRRGNSTPLTSTVQFSHRPTQINTDN